jgi:hypothetical protein
MRARFVAALFGDDGPGSRGGSELSGRGGSELSASGSPRQKTKSPRTKRDPAKETLKVRASASTLVCLLYTPRLPLGSRWGGLRLSRLLREVPG